MSKLAAGKERRAEYKLYSLFYVFCGQLTSAYLSFASGLPLS